jgi:hypothetical protein
MSKRLDDLYEEAGRRIYEAQQARLSDKNCLSAKRPWRSRDVPETFWDSYCADARAALSLTHDVDQVKINGVSLSIQHEAFEPLPTASPALDCGSSKVAESYGPHTPTMPWF